MSWADAMEGLDPDRAPRRTENALKEVEFMAEVSRFASGSPKHVCTEAAFGCSAQCGRFTALDHRAVFEDEYLIAEAENVPHVVAYDKGGSWFLDRIFGLESRAWFPVFRARERGVRPRAV